MTTITDDVERFIETKKRVGYRYVCSGKDLRNFARFAKDRNETFIRAETALEWASAASRNREVRKLRLVHNLASWLHAEDDRHEVPNRDALGPADGRRPKPSLVSILDIQKLLSAALSLGPTGTINPLTWHYMFGLIAVTGLRIGEALALTLDDIVTDGLIIQDTKFGKTRMVVLHPTTWAALNLYLETRLKEATQNRHLFIISPGQSPAISSASRTFRILAEQVGIRKPGAVKGVTLHSLRHAFAIRSLEMLSPTVKTDRHMLALATYLGHANVTSTYWYLESTQTLLKGIAETTERAHAKGDDQ